MAEGAEEPTFTLRYQLTPADGRAALYAGLREWIPVLIGIVLTTLLCATWSPLGRTGRHAAIVIPIVTVLALLWLVARASRAVEPYVGREFVVSFARDGIGIDSGLTKFSMAWIALGRIARGRGCWLFYARDGADFYVPAAAIPAEARAFIARWAGEAGATLT